MTCLRPATPGFLVTLAATIILAIVSFSVPFLKSIYFLKASITEDGFTGSITFGTLGYCLQLSNGTTCSSPSVGYELDINGLVGNNLPIQIPVVVVKWLTYALFLHVIALILSAGSALFGLLAHVREMSMTCCSSFFSGFAATVALVAFVFDIALFFIAKARISKIGSAQIGIAVWLTLAAWILLFFSGCFYSIGRCCMNGRSRGGDGWGRRKDNEEELRLDAIRAEADRKALQAKREGGLPAFHEYQPLEAGIDGDVVYLAPYQDTSLSSSSTQSGRAGYSPAAQGTRAIDEYYKPSSGGYQPSQHSSRRRNSATTVTTASHPPTVHTSPPPQQTYLDGYASTQPQTYGAQRNASYSNPFNTPSQAYGHGQQASSYSTVPIHEQEPSGNSNYSQYNDPYAPRQVKHQASYQSATSNMGRYTPVPAAAVPPPPPPPPPPPQRNYSLGGAGYNSSPPPSETHPSYQSPLAPVNANVSYVSPLTATTSPVRGPRAQPPSSTSQEEAPPGYDVGW